MGMVQDQLFESSRSSQNSSAGPTRNMRHCLRSSLAVLLAHFSCPSANLSRRWSISFSAHISATTHTVSHCACSTSSPSGNQVDGLPLVANLVKQALYGHILEEKYTRRVSDPATWPIHLIDFSGFILDFPEIGSFVWNYLLD